MYEQSSRADVRDQVLTAAIGRVLAMVPLNRRGVSFASLAQVVDHLLFAAYWPCLMRPCPSPG